MSQFSPEQGILVKVVDVVEVKLEIVVILEGKDRSHDWGLFDHFCI